MKNLVFLCIIFYTFFNALPVKSKLPVKSYASLPNLNQVKLSPNGKYLSMIKNYNGTLYLTTYEIETKKTRYIIQADNINVLFKWYAWANDDVLLISAAYPTREGQTKYTSTRLLRMDLTVDKKPVVLVKPKIGRRDINAQFQDNIISFLPEKPNKILVAIAFEEHNRPTVYEVDVRTKKRTRVQRYKANTFDWIADQQGTVRIAIGKKKTELFYELFDLKTKEWRDLSSYKIFQESDIDILGFDLNPNFLYIRALHKNRYAIFKVDVSNPMLSKELVFFDEKYDVDGSLLYSPATGEVIGLSHSNSDDLRVYWDDEYKNFQKALKKALPDSENTIISMTKDLSKYILFSTSTSSAGDYYIGDRKKQNMHHLASLYPDINKSNYAGKSLIQYKARDGVIIEAYLTTPINYDENKKLPAIILPHGGPMARDYGGFDYWSELFANQGYVVLQPNFRGSSGYGFEFEMAAIQGWGKAMQDDLQDATNWLIKQGIVNQNRICIAGASYGGYAALMAAVKHPKTYKCAVSFAGVTDIELIVSNARRFTNSAIVKKQFGTDSDKLEAVSPVNFAEKIEIPILLIHGADDRVVLVNHSREMAEELEEHNKKFKYIELEDGNHHLSVQSHRIETLENMVNFFNEHIGNL